MNLSWNSLNVHKNVQLIMKQTFGFESMTTVQSATIPLFLANKDVAVEAVTGSGKTLAFIIPVLEMMRKKCENENISKHDINAIIVSPTRELANQTFDVLNRFIDNTITDEFSKFKSLLLIGGTNPQQDIDKYISNGANIIVSTPGRLFDLFEKCDQITNKVRKCLEVFVLDEADQLLSLGFENALNYILSYLPKQRRTALFSATQTKKLEQLIRAGLRNPVRIEIKEKNVSANSDECLQMPQTLTNSYIILDSCEHKLSCVIEFVKQNLRLKYIIFMSTCAQVNYFEKPILKFLSKSMPVFKLHRKLKNKRQKIFDEFKNSVNGVLICTDVMSRGIDIPRVDWVIHFDLPNTVESYVHRCGRSGHQIGQIGNSLMIALNSETDFIDTCVSKQIELNVLDFKADSQHTKSILDFVRKESRKDPKYYELGMQAFVSFIKTYSTKHCMSAILYKSLDTTDLANGYGLLQIPFMPELKARNRGSTVFKATYDDKCIAFGHKKAKYETQKANNPIKMPIKRDISKSSLMIKNCKLKGKRKKEYINEIEMLELADDAKMVKKLKKGKISAQQFDKHFGLF